MYDPLYDPIDKLTMQAKFNQRSRRVWSRVRLSAILAAALLTAAVVLLAVLQHRSGNSPQPATPASQSDYVDAAVCSNCHQAIAETYRKTGMGRSFFIPTTANAVEDYAHANIVFHQPSGLRYVMIQRNGEFFERRSEVGFDGKETDVMEERIDYVIGSGNHSRSYLHRAPDGQLIELPVSWYSEGTGYWAMSPGYDWKGQTDFRRAINGECMFCHNGYPESNAGIERSIFPEKLPQGIDCQRCHGPGRAHVEAAMSGHAAPELIRSTIVNPGRLDRDRQLEVCMECHLKTSFHEPNEERAFDRAIFSYRPGQPLEDFKLYFEPVGHESDDTFEIDHAAYRLRKSACFRNSQMTCLTCHDPHDIPRGPEAVKHYTEVCLGCHQGVAHTVALPPTSTCLSCHMPKRRTSDAVHVVMTDHFIRRTEPQRNLLAPIAETIAPEGSFTKVALYYSVKAPATPEAEISMAEAQVLAAAPTDDNAIPKLQALLERYQPNSPEPYLVLAQACDRAGNNEEVVRWSRQALAERENFRPAIVMLAPALFALHRDAEATKVLEEAVRQYPTDDLMLSDLGNAYLRQGEIAQASSVLKRALTSNPERSETHNLLGAVAVKQGDSATGEREFREALRLQPDFPEARDNLGSLLAEEHNYTEAQFQFEKAIDADADLAEAHHHLGRLLVLMDQAPHAISELRKAAQLEPDDPEVHEDLADVLAATGHAAEAIPEYERVLALRPDQSQAQLALAMALLSQYRVAEARLHLQAAAKSADPEIAQTARRLLALQ
jgi:predicted CXXCH cytochrome family protein